MTVLRQRMTEDMQVRNLSSQTQTSYLQQVSLFARHFRMSPDALTPEHIRTYQIYLQTRRGWPPIQYTRLLRRFGSFTGLRSRKNGPLEKTSRFQKSRRSCPSS